MEEAKTQENAKLQSALQEMQLQFKETKEMLVKEREAAAIKVAEKVPVIQEVPVVDHVALEKLAIENEKLKVRRIDSQGSLFRLMMPTFISLHEVKASQKFSPILG